MPQKAIFSRAPLMTCRSSALSNGQVRTNDARAERLYSWLCGIPEEIETWEAAFSLACLLRDKPMEEESAGRILEAVRQPSEGMFSGKWDRQLQIASAALAVYEYTTDKEILKRLASWCGELEVHWEEAAASGSIRVHPADWMSFLVRFYRITGLKAVLRLCTRLRAAAMDWTTLLHSFHQRQPLARTEDPEAIREVLKQNAPDEEDFFNRQVIINHAEWLADGMRYTAWAGIFSGNGQDLTAGEKGWQAIARDHGMACGGTTADVLLAGKGTDNPADAAAVAAWAEAFVSQTLIQEAPWALNALTRIVWNALPACLADNGPVLFQRVNAVRPQEDGNGRFAPDDSAGYRVHALARLGRAAASVWKAAVTVTKDGIQMQLGLPGKYAVGVNREPFAVTADETGTAILGKKGVNVPIRLYRAETETRDILVEMGGKTAAAEGTSGPEGTFYSWQGDGSEMCRVIYRENDHFSVCREHHESISCFRANELLAAEIQDGDFCFAACGEPMMKDGQPMLPVMRITGWRKKNGDPADVPVLPEGRENRGWVPLNPYRDTAERIAVFPRTRA